MNKYCMTEHKLLTEKYLIDKGYKISSQSLKDDNIIYFVIDKNNNACRFVFNKFEAIVNFNKKNFVISDDVRDYILEREPAYREPLIRYLTGKLNKLRVAKTTRLMNETDDEYKSRVEGITKAIKNISARLSTLIQPVGHNV